VACIVRISMVTSLFIHFVSAEVVRTVHASLKTDILLKGGAMPRRFPQPDSQRANPPHVAVRHGANRFAAGAGTRAFRGINGRLPTAVSLWWAPSIYSTLPCVRTLSQRIGIRTATDECGAGRTPCEDPMAEGTKPNPAPSEIEAVTFVEKTHEVA
jgi:hypothetical protein